MITTNTIAPTMSVDRSLNIWLYDANISNSGTVPGINYNDLSSGIIMMYGNSSIESSNVKSNTTNVIFWYKYIFNICIRYGSHYTVCFILFRFLNIIIYTSSSVDIDDSYNPIIILQASATKVSYDPESQSTWIDNFGMVPTLCFRCSKYHFFSWNDRSNRTILHRLYRTNRRYRINR